MKRGRILAVMAAAWTGGALLVHRTAVFTAALPFLAGGAVLSVAASNVNNYGLRMSLRAAGKIAERWTTRMIRVLALSSLTEKLLGWAAAEAWRIPGLRIPGWNMMMLMSWADCAEKQEDPRAMDNGMRAMLAAEGFGRRALSYADTADDAVGLFGGMDMMAPPWTTQRMRIAAIRKRLSNGSGMFTLMFGGDMLSAAEEALGRGVERRALSEATGPGTAEKRPAIRI